VIVIELESKEINNLLEFCLLFQTERKHTLVTNEDLLFLNPDLMLKFESILDNNYGWFVKTSFKSGKKSPYGCFPCYTIVDILNNLVHTTDVTFSLLRKDVSLIFRPWNTNISKQDEFRLFVFDGQLTNISQNYPSVVLIQEINENFMFAIIEWWQLVHRKMIESGWWCQDYNLDIYAYQKEPNNYDIGLIEVNSGGKWSTSASCLFDYNNMPSNEMWIVQ
jgi:hypothetical protein